MKRVYEALAARERAASMSPQNPLIYAAWRHFSYLESQLTDDEHTALGQLLRTGRRR